MSNALNLNMFIKVIIVPTLVCFGDRLFEVERKQSISSFIREEVTSWVVIDSCSYGISSREGMARFQEDVLFHSPDLVAIMFGIHDANQPNPVTIQEYNTNLRYMVNKLTPSKTVLISPVPIENRKQAALNNEIIEKYAKETEKIAEETKSAYINLWNLVPSNSKQQLLYDTLVNQLINKLLTSEDKYKDKRNIFNKFNESISRVF